MKTLKILIIFAFVLIALTTAFGQTATERFQVAKEASENSQFEKTLTLLDAIEKDFGKSPRVESLRALTLRDLNRPRDAYLSVLTYFKLTEGKDLSDNAAHKVLIGLRDTLKSQLETDLSIKKDNLQAERNTNANKAISETDMRSNQSTQSSTTADPLAELEMWNKVKTSINANDYYLFLMRFPAGGFAKQAKAKMNEIGDPIWNEIKNSKDPFVFRDYIAKNPNSPFMVEAKEKMNMLAASIIAWEQIKDSTETEKFVEFLNKYPNGAQAKEAGKKVTAFYANILKSYYPWQHIKRGLSAGTERPLTIKYINEISFIDNCKIVIITKKLAIESWDDVLTFETPLDLSDILISTIISQQEYDSGFLPLATNISFATSNFSTLKFTKYKDNNFTSVISSETKNFKAGGGSFALKNVETATQFSKDLINAVKVCSLVNK